MILVTGGAGFIGSNFVHHWLRRDREPILILDKLTYAGNPRSIDTHLASGRARLVEGDICDPRLVRQLLLSERPRALVHFAAESHVDRSIHGPDEFVQTNVVGTFRLLEQARLYYATLKGPQRDCFRFLHVSTDEVYGSLRETDPPFTETTPYAPNSPYSASKAGSDHLVRAYWHTFGLPVLTTNCSNNYGPYQFPEKLVPLMILNALNEEPLPVYGDGNNVRDWLYVQDHCEAIIQVLERGRCGETYNIGGKNEVRNLEVVKAICSRLDEIRPRPSGCYEELITFVADRPGHDRRYAIDPSKIEREIGWIPAEDFTSGMDKTVRWYLSNNDWIDGVRSGEYRHWLVRNYSARQ